MAYVDELDENDRFMDFILWSAGEKEINENCFKESFK